MSDSRSTGQDKVRAQLEEIALRTGRATAGPWEVYVGADLMVLHPKESGYDEIASTGSGADTLRDADAAFIAESRTDIPALIAALTAVLDRIEQVKLRLPAERIAAQADSVAVVRYYGEGLADGTELALNDLALTIAAGLGVTP